MALKDTKYDWAFGKFYINNVLFNQYKSQDVPKGDLGRFNYFHGISIMSLVRASANPIFDEDLLRYDDYDLWLTLDKNGHKGLFVDKILFSTSIKKGDISDGDDENRDYWMTKLKDKHLIRKRIADIIIPHHNRHDHLKNCLERLDNSLFNIIIVSGGSFAENCNKGAKIATTDNLIFLNDDTLPDNDILQEMVETDGDVIGLAQTMPKNKDLIFYGIGYYKNQTGLLHARLARNPEDSHIPSGFCFLVRKRIWKEMNGLDERFRNGGEDQDFGFRAIDKGYKINYVNKPIVHYQSQSEGRFRYGRDNELLRKQIWPDNKIICLLKL